MSVSSPVDTLLQRQLSIGEHGVGLFFDNQELAELADQRLYLYPFAGSASVRVNFQNDDSITELTQHLHTASNAVLIRWLDSVDGNRSRLVMKVFNEFTVLLNFSDSIVDVFYTSSTVLTYLLDDVLQAAIQPLLKSLNGFILHGACLVANNQAVALLGNSGAGKSTTAFNLAYAGFDCYADDAVIVTEHKGELYAWPFSRELSLRPLSYALLKRQGVEFSGYRRDGKKYYFPQPPVSRQNGAKLTHACLIRVAGEEETYCHSLSKEQFKQALLDEERFFSFVNRENHQHYAEVVVDKISNLWDTALGYNFSSQAKKIFQLVDVVVDENATNNIGFKLQFPSQSEKLQIIKKAWRAGDSPDVSDVIPLLSDSDLKIFKNALSFFQNYSVARLCPLAEAPLKSTENLLTDAHYFPSWLDFSGWSEGAELLVSLSCYEVYEQYAAGWFVSAPLLYPFMLKQLDPATNEFDIVVQSWKKAVAVLTSEAKTKSTIVYVLPDAVLKTDIEFIDTKSNSAKLISLSDLASALIDLIDRQKQHVTLFPLFTNPAVEVASFFNVMENLTASMSSVSFAYPLPIQDCLSRSSELQRGVEESRMKANTFSLDHSRECFPNLDLVFSEDISSAGWCGLLNISPGGYVQLSHRASSC